MTLPNRVLWTQGQARELEVYTDGSKTDSGTGCLKNRQIKNI